MTNCVISLVVAAMMSATGDVTEALREGARLERTGDLKGALNAYRQALDASREGSPDHAEALLGVAGAELRLGKYDNAGQHARQAAQAFEAQGNVARAAVALNRAGAAALFAGEYQRAEEAFSSAFERSVKLGDREGQAEQLGNLANVQFFLGRYGEAARFYDQALAVTTSSRTEAWAARRRRIILANQATLYQRLGRDPQALEAYKELGTESTDLRPNERAQMLVNLGALYRRLGDPVKALETYDEARALFASDRQVDGELGMLKNRGIVLTFDLGRLDEAERTFTMALDRATKVSNRREMLHGRLYRGETRYRSGRIDDAREDFAAGLTLARELLTPEEEWKALYGLGRVASPPDRAIGLFEDAIRTIEQVRENIPIASLRSDFLNDKRAVYDALIAARARAPSPSPELLFGLLERSHSRVWRERLGLTRAVDLRSVQNALPARLLLLDYWNSDLGSAVVAVSGTRAAVVPIQVNAGEIQSLLDAVSAGPASKWRELSARVAAGVLPAPEWFDGIDHVLIVPDGVLSLVPFELLPLGQQLLIETAAVAYTPTAATLLREAPRDSRWLPPWRLQLRAFADPVFASAPLDDLAPSSSRLSASADEAHLIASELAGRSALHLGADNRKAYLVGASEHAPILHLATHAVTDASAAEQSRIVFSSPTESGARADYLFLREAHGLKLSDVDLAVLSACETERGRFVGGEGVENFSRAFMAAGARSTVTTMWRVADRPTADFMQLFYHHLQRGVPRDEALRRAKLRFLQTGTDLADPHFWAAFVLTGDGLRPVPRAISWNVLVTTAVGLLLVPAAAIRFHRRRRLSRQTTS